MVTMPLKLLVIENDKPAAGLLSQVLSGLGAEVRIATDATSASVLVGQTKFDGIFLELGLVGMDGVGLTRSIREASWNTSTPIVLVGRNPDPQVAARAFQAGGTLFLPKPLNLSAIRGAFVATRALMFDERYRYRRIPLTTPMQCFAGARELNGCTSRNLSSSGMLREGDGTLHPRDRIRLLFRLDTHSRNIPAGAQVIWVDGDNRAGVRFLAINQEDRRRIRARVSSEVDNLSMKSI